LSKKPNFFIIGAGKSGTTSIYHYIKQHPQIFMSPVKEPNYFAFTGQEPDCAGPGDRRVLKSRRKSKAEYLELFTGATDEIAVGEVSVVYLGDDSAAERIAAEYPDARIIVFLRQPADRAYSAYMHLRRDGYEPLASFADALDAEKDRIKQGYYVHWHYHSRGLYTNQLRPWFEHFKREQIRVYLYQDFSQQPFAILADLFRFLGVDDDFLPDISVRHNQSGIARSQSLQNLFSQPHPAKDWLKRIMPERFGHKLISLMQPGNLKTPAMTEQERSQLSESYRDEILQLQELIQQDLSDWLPPEPDLADSDQSDPKAAG